MEPKIVVKNSTIYINNYEINDCERLEKYFLLYERVTHSYKTLGIHYDKENKRLYLPRGIDIFFVEKLFNEEAYIEKDGYDEYDIYTDILIKYLPKDDIQKQALRFVLGKGEYFQTATKSQLQVNLNTGKGKTYISIAAFAYTGIKTIIIASSVSWLKQWKERTLEYCNLTNREIYNISGSGSIYRLLNETQDKIKQYKILLVTHATLKSYGDTNGWNKIGELFKHLKIGIKIYDEAHLNFANICMVDAYTNTYKSYYLTATALKSSKEEDFIYQLAFKNVLSIDLFDPETDPHTDYIGIRYNSKPTPMQISSCKGAYGLDRNRYVNHIVHCDRFYEMLVVVFDFIRRNLGPYDKCLIFIGTNNAIIKVRDWLIERYPELKYELGIYTSIIPPEEKIIALQKRFILSTTKSAGAAVDIPGLKMTVVLAEPFKSEVLARQTLGRTRANNTMYIEIVDVGFNYCYKYYISKKSIFKKYARDCSEVIISDEELDNRYNKLIREEENMIHPMILNKNR